MKETEIKLKYDKNKNNKKKASEEEPPAGYIHVRARRGQATDSHSLAERVLKCFFFFLFLFFYLHGFHTMFTCIISKVLISYLDFLNGFQVRRLKINERMKLLQGLVPGCDKVNFTR